MNAKCRNCKNLIMTENREYKCRCYDKEVSPDNDSSGCPYSRICYVLFDRLPIIEELYKK